MSCRVCGRRIHRERLAVQPNVKTCSQPCAQEYRRRLNRESSHRQTERRRESRAAAA